MGSLTRLITVGGVVLLGAGSYLLYRHLTRNQEVDHYVYKAEEDLRELLTPTEEDIVQECLVEDLTLMSHTSSDSVTPKRLRKKTKAPFRKYLLREAKAKFGLPSASAANRLVVRQFLVDICKQRGLIARHIVENVDIVTEAVFVPSEEDLTMLALQSTTTAKRKLGIAEALRGRSRAALK